MSRCWSSYELRDRLATVNTLKAAYVTTYDSSDKGAWSGLGYQIAHCLELADIAVERIGPLKRRVSPMARGWQLQARLHLRTYALDRDPAVAEAYAADVRRRLEMVGCDLVFSPGTIPVAHLSSSHPVAIWADATFAAILRSYPQLQSLSRRAVRNGLELDNRGLARASVAFFASEWAARSAVDDHGADPAKVEVMPFGANMPINHSRDAVVELIRRRAEDRCRLLWVGVDWVRKGGDRAVEVARVLNKRGLATELDVVGCNPPGELPEWVHVHGFVDKMNESGGTSLRRLYGRAHILVHPAAAECFGVVFCEAAAHGVPSAASRVGGVSSAVREGITGALFEQTAPAEEYADYVWWLLEDRRRYEAMAVGAFDEYQRVLSWDVQAKRLGTRLAQLA
jgi:glycosyltransferase involved in cell wall biosynthesis